MRTTIDAASRLVIPKEIRRAAGLRPGRPLEVSWRDGHIEIEPAPMGVDLVRKGRLLGEVVQQTQETVPRERFERLF